MDPIGLEIRRGESGLSADLEGRLHRGEPIPCGRRWPVGRE